MGWDKTVPTTATHILEIANLHYQNWSAIESTLEKEHYTFGESLVGRHWPGHVGALFIGTSAAITGLSGVAEGALALDTDKGVTKLYYGSVWNEMQKLTYPYVHAYKASNSSLSAGQSGVVGFDTEVTDSLGEWNNSTYMFTPVNDGVYLFRAQMSITPGAGGMQIDTYVVFTGGGVTNVVHGEIWAISRDETTLPKSVELNLTAGSTVYIIMSNSSESGSITINGGADRTVLQIRRIS